MHGRISGHFPGLVAIERLAAAAAAVIARCTGLGQQREEPLEKFVETLHGAGIVVEYDHCAGFTELDVFHPEFLHEIVPGQLAIQPVAGCVGEVGGNGQQLIACALGQGDGIALIISISNAAGDGQPVFGGKFFQCRTNHGQTLPFLFYALGEFPGIIMPEEAEKVNKNLPRKERGRFGCYWIFSKASTPCLHRGQMKSSGSVSPS